MYKLLNIMNFTDKYKNIETGEIKDGLDIVKQLNHCIKVIKEMEKENPKLLYKVVEKIRKGENYEILQNSKKIKKTKKN